MEPVSRSRVAHLATSAAVVAAGCTFLGWAASGRSVRSSYGLFQAAGRAGLLPDSIEFLADDSAVGVFDEERVFERQTAGVHQTAEHVRREPGTFFVGEEPDGQRSGEFDVGSHHGLDHFETGEHAQIAVVATTRRNRVDV